MGVEDILIEYATTAEAIRKQTRILRVRCEFASKPDSSCGDPGCDSCLGEFFSNVAEARHSGEGMTYENARNEVLADMDMCDACKDKLPALETRKMLRVKCAGIKRRLETAGKRLAAKRKTETAP